MTLKQITLKKDMKIYHNPRCSKSRQTLEIIQQEGKDVEVIKYLEATPTASELREIIHLLHLEPIDLVRKNEAVWKEQFKGKTLTNDEIIEAMLAHPKLIERPIVISNNQAIIGRPPENVRRLF